MKLTNKILLAFIILIFASFIALRININSKVELVPNAYNDKRLHKEITVKKFTTLNVKGMYSVHLIHSDFDSLFITGPDNLIDNYTLIENKNDILKITSKTDLQKYPNEIEVWLYTKNIESIKVSNNAVVLAEGFNGTKLNLSAEDSSMIDCLNCNYTNSAITIKDKATVSLDKTQNAFVDVRNSSTLFLDKGNVTGIVSYDGELLINGDAKNNTLIKGENKNRRIK